MNVFFLSFNFSWTSFFFFASFHFKAKGRSTLDNNWIMFKSRLACTTSNTNHHFSCRSISKLSAPFVLNYVYLVSERVLHAMLCTTIHRYQHWNPLKKLLKAVRSYVVEIRNLFALQFHEKTCVRSHGWNVNYVCGVWSIQLRI